MACQCVVDYKLVLGYVQAVLSFPTVILIIAGVFLWKFKDAVRALIGRIKEAELPGGMKLGFEAAAAAVIATKATEEIIEKRREEVSRMEEGEAKQKRIADLEAEAKVLRARFLSALISEKFDLLELIRNKELLNALDNMLWYPRGLLGPSMTDEQIMYLLGKNYPQYSVQTHRRVLDLAKLERGINDQITARI